MPSVLNYYVDFVNGRFNKDRVNSKSRLELLLSRFTLEGFLGKWNQVATSRSTSLFYTGTGLKNVQAEYTARQDTEGGVNVYNTTDTPNPVGPKIIGRSEAVSLNVPTCRTVDFNRGPPGNYWILYISCDRQTMIVAAPLIVENCLVQANFALYILTKRLREHYWSVDNRSQRAEIGDICRRYHYTKCWNMPIRTD